MTAGRTARVRGWVFWTVAVTALSSAMVPTAGALPPSCDVSSYNFGDPPIDVFGGLYNDGSAHAGCSLPGVAIDIRGIACNDTGSCRGDFHIEVDVCANVPQLVDIAWARQASGDHELSSHSTSPRPDDPSCPHLLRYETMSPEGTIANIWETVAVTVVARGPAETATRSAVLFFNS